MNDDKIKRAELYSLIRKHHGLSARGSWFLVLKYSHPRNALHVDDVINMYKRALAKPS